MALKPNNLAIKDNLITDTVNAKDLSVKTELYHKLNPIGETT